MLQAFRAMHDYSLNTIQVRDHRWTAMLMNQIANPHYTGQTTNKLLLTTDWKQHAPHPPQEKAHSEDHTTSTMWVGKNPNQMELDDVWSKIPAEALDAHTETPNHQINPFHADRIRAILKVVNIGEDLTSKECRKVRDLITAHADCFTLSVHKVVPARDATLHLKVPDNMPLLTKTCQHTFTPPQRCYLHKKILEMLEAGIIECADPAKIKCISLTTLGQKQHDGAGLMLEELQHKVNQECTAAGLTPHFQVPLWQEAHASATTHEGEQKWRICQDFREVNKHTKVAPMPQGDICAKQHRLSSHRYISVIDFTSGFYTVEIDTQLHPYTAFYIKGLGHFWYARMPFGLTGAPTTFTSVTATHLHNLIADKTLEIFADDGGTVADTFNDMIHNLTRILSWVRDRKLSLLAAKMKLFMSEAMFAGAQIGQCGVLPDLTKLTAVVDWRQPTTTLNLVSFLGLTGHFRDLIKAYVCMKGPLRDLLTRVPLPQPCTKSSYRQVMGTYHLDNKWEDRHTKAFLDLKIAITSEPILQGPCWDGMPFIMTTDGCKERFAGVLAQRFPYTKPNGSQTQKIHPIAFTLKRTSPSGAKYKLFLLEFMALKFSLDKFSNIIWGFPIKIKTDCQALHDTLLSKKLSTIHTC
jgi:Reverse transcriptase (RNA-dependent DNA polymerase)/RNase H-like domain found in reverse transcriptase